MLDISWFGVCFVVLSATTLPAGLGAAVLGWRRGHPLLCSGLPYSLLAASLWLVGLTVFAVAHTLLARIGVGFQIANTALIAVAMIGLVLLVVTSPVKRVSAIDSAVFASLFGANLVIRYFYQFDWLSHYPFGDLFQEVHTFGAVFLFRDTAQLDFMTTTSYIPLRQALYTAYYATAGIGPLPVYWYLPVVFGLVSTLVAWGLGRAMGLCGSGQWAVAAPLSLLLGFVVVTNGTLLGVVSLALMGVLLYRVAGTPLLARRSHFFVLIGLSVLTVVADMVLNRLELKPTVLPVAVVAAAIVFAAKDLSDRASSVLLAILLVCAGIALHRGSALFLPAVLAGVGLLHLFRYVAARHDGPRLRRTMGTGLVALGLLSLVFPVLTALEEVKLVTFGGRMLELYSMATTIVIGEPLRAGSDLMLGTGPRVALIEMIRMVGPTAAIVVGVVAIAGIVERYFVHISDREPLDELDLTAAWAWAMATSLMIMIGSGLPFAYRVGYLMMTFLMIAMSLFALQLRRVGTKGSIPMPVVAAVSAGLASFAVLYVVLYSPDGRLSGSEVAQYLRLTAPFVLAVGLAALVAFVAAVLLRHRAYALTLCVFSIALVIQADQKGMTSVFLRYSFGTPPERVDWISFYSKSEIDLVRSIAADGRPWIVVSDPVTISIARAFGGAMSAYNYSNLDTVSPGTRNRLEQVMRSVLDIGDRSEFAPNAMAHRFCASLLTELASNPSVDILQHLYEPPEILRMARMSPPAPGYPEAPHFVPTEPLVSAEDPPLTLWEDLLGTDLGRRLAGSVPDSMPWRLVMIATPRTLRWLAASKTDPSPYFPIDGDVRSTVGPSVAYGRFPIIEQSPAALAVEITCPWQGSTSQKGADRP